MYLISNNPLEQLTNYEKSTQIPSRPPNVFLSLTHNRFPPETFVLKGLNRPPPPPHAILWKNLFVWYQMQTNLITQLRVKVGTILCLFKYFSSHRHGVVMCELPSFWGGWQRAELWVGRWISTPGPKLLLQMFTIPPAGHATTPGGQKERILWHCNPLTPLYPFGTRWLL